MKKTIKRKSGSVESGHMRSEYNFDFRKARPNRFAGRIDKERLVVVLDPDISEVFTTPGSVNTILRAKISEMPVAANSKIGAQVRGERDRAERRHT